MPDYNDAARGSSFSRAEKNYIVARCLRSIAGIEKMNDGEIADELNRGRNNISILRRNLGFSYEKDNETGENKIVYKKPKNKDYYINLDSFDVNYSIATMKYQIEKNKLIKEQKNSDNLDVKDFYPSDEKVEYSEEELKNIANNILDKEEIDIEIKDNIKKDGFEDGYDDNSIDVFPTIETFTENEDNKDVDIKNNINENIKINEDIIIKNNNILKNKKSDIYTNEYFDDISFDSIRSALEDDEWNFFKSRWQTYCVQYKDQFNATEDFDDLTGLLTEIIKRKRLLGKEKKGQGEYDKELSESTKRYELYKKNLSTSRLSRISRNVDERVNIADLIADFEDDKRYIELIFKAEEEMDRIIKWGKENLNNPITKDDFDKIDGNEEALLAGIDLDNLRSLLTAQR